MTAQDKIARIEWDLVEATIIRLRFSGAIKAREADEFTALVEIARAADVPGDRRLADDEVCACLHETGERKVEIVERCVRCGSFMYSDAYHDAKTALAEIEAKPYRAEEVTARWRRG